MNATTKNCSFSHQNLENADWFQIEEFYSVEVEANGFVLAVKNFSMEAQLQFNVKLSQPQPINKDTVWSFVGIALGYVAFIAVTVIIVGWKKKKAVEEELDEDALMIKYIQEGYTQ